MSSSTKNRIAEHLTPQQDASNRVSVPPNVARRLVEYRGCFRRIKLLEAIGAVICALTVSYCLMFVLDRTSDPSRFVRYAALMVGLLVAMTWLPWMIYRWVWKSRRLDQVARILKGQSYEGDHLLGVIELAECPAIAGQSETLRLAALAQADREMETKSFVDKVPTPRHRLWLATAGAGLVVVLMIFAMVPSAAMNSFWRWMLPAASIPRFTFARLSPLPESIIVPDSEAVALPVKLSADTQWSPSQGRFHVGTQRFQVPVQEHSYGFQIPPLKEPALAKVRIGDVFACIAVTPRVRPELNALAAQVQLPEYLQRTEPEHREIRGGVLNVLQGSRIQISGEASRTLVEASLASQPMRILGSKVVSQLSEISEASNLLIDWKDNYGLSPVKPLKLQVNVVPDAAPSVICQQLKSQLVLMEKNTLTFQVNARDDFGIRQLGFEWKTIADENSDNKPTRGEKVIYAGSPTSVEASEQVATFTPTKDNVAPQSIELRVYAEDYLPGRPRSYSVPYIVHILSETDHAVWLTRQIEVWVRQCLETYDREQQLYNANHEMVGGLEQDTSRFKIVRKIDSQATAERSQSRRLRILSALAQQLLGECTQNLQISASSNAELESIASELIEIAETQMPEVATLLQQATNQGAQLKPALTKALARQEQLLSKFQVLVERMRSFLLKLETTSFATRLQSLANQELTLRQDVLRSTITEFGKARADVPDSTVLRSKLYAQRQGTHYKTFSDVVTDLEAYSGRNPKPMISKVLAEVTSKEALQQARMIGDRLSSNDSGTAAANCEMLADNFLRWAEMLLHLPDSKEGEDQKRTGNLPPKLTRELLRILKREIVLRDSTRMLDQSRSGLAATDYQVGAKALADEQFSLAEAAEALVRAISALPDGEKLFGKEIGRINNAAGVMREAIEILRTPETGSTAIAAENEVIELLEDSAKSRSKSKGGSGKGSGEGSRTGQDISGLVEALTGSARNDTEAPDRATQLGTGSDADKLPEEFRSGMERLYQAIEKSGF